MKENQEKEILDLLQVSQYATIDELAEKQVPEMGHEMLRVACDEGAEIVRLRAEADTYKHMYFDLLDRVTK